MRPLLLRLVPPRLPPTRRRPAHTTAIAAAVGLLSCCCSWLAAGARAVDTTTIPAAATRASYPGFVRPLASRSPAPPSSQQQCYSYSSTSGPRLRGLPPLLGASSGGNGDGDSIGAHKATVLGIHDQYPGAHPAGVTRQLHNKRQAGVFDEQARFFAGEEATPPEVVPRLKAIAAAASPLDATTRILDVGTGAGVLIPYLKALGVAEGNVTGVDVSPGMLVVAKRRYPTAAFWEGDVADFPPPAWNASFDAVYMNAVFGNLYDQPAAMEALGALTARGARVVISHPLGAGFVEELKRRSPAVVLSPLPTSEADFEALLRFARFELRSLQNDPELYIAVLDWQPHQQLKEAVYLRGPVSKGYGRGSKKLGVPTANLPESLFAEALRDVPTGVYLGWASVGGKRCKAVVNVGYSPTFVGHENQEKIVEAHLIDAEAALGGEDFYDEEMRLVLAGFQRPERRFPSFPDLVAAIHQDVADARAALDLPRYQAPGLLGLLEDGDATNRRLPFAEWGS